jgi:hypothetical protein
MQSRSRYRITLKMLEAGANRMAQCRVEPGHTPQSVSSAIFVAMLDAADIHAGASLAESFAWSPHDLRRPHTPAGKPRKRPKGQPLVREDFDGEGKRVIGTHEGKLVYQYLKNIWYLRKGENTKP